MQQCTLVLFGLLAAVTACDDYAMVDDLRTVERKVENVDDRTKADRLDYEDSYAKVVSRTELVEVRQAQVEHAFSEMGHGFNTLSAAVQDADEKAEEVRTRQIRFERKVTRSLSAIQQTAPDAVDERKVLTGTGTDRQTNEALLPIWLIIEDGTLSLRRALDANASASIETVVEELGRRLYASGAEGLSPFCLEILQRNDDGTEMHGSACDNPYQVWHFVAE